MSDPKALDILVCGAQKPFMHGGAEQHQENLVTALRAAGHRVELVRIPVGWEKGRVFDSPTAWRLIPADADLVIATNFPSYFISHPNKVVWLFHQHRAAYDGAESKADWSDFGYDDGAVEEARLLTEWDNIALGEAQRIYSTSQVVADRLARFNGLSATPLYHPPPLFDRLRPGEFGDYVFAIQRFDQNKRPGMIAEGLSRSSTRVRGVSAGRGELLDPVRHRARELRVDARLDLPGFVSDEKAIDLFGNALAVLYAPADEDMGYVNLQAFYAGKPVITARDSGGVLEWVEDGVTGIVTDGSPKQLGEAFDRLDRDRALARKMGEAGRERVRDLSWDDAVATLIGG
ncbi:MAG: glycosyltransferase family 4 protein [Mycobacteriales bacterium]